MTKAELVAAMAEQSGLTKEQSKKALDAFTDAVTSALKEGQDVRLVGFGTFAISKRAAGTARNPRTGEAVERPASSTVRFRVGEALKTAVN